MQAAPPNLTGEWIADVTKKGLAPYQIALDLEMVGIRLFGTAHYPTGDAGIQDGEIEGAHLRFRTVHTPQFAMSRPRSVSRARSPAMHSIWSSRMPTATPG